MMLRRGTSILSFEYPADAIELSKTSHWDQTYSSDGELLLVPDFYFLLTYGRALPSDIYLPFTIFVLKGGSFRFAFLEDNFDEMYSYFQRGQSIIKRAYNDFDTYIDQVQEHPILTDLVKRWEDLQKTRDESQQIDLKSVMSLIDAYQNYLEAAKNDDLISTILELDLFEREYRRPLQRIAKLANDRDLFYRPNSRDTRVYSDEDHAIKQRLSTYLNNRRKGKNLANEIDSSLLSRCHSRKKYYETVGLKEEEKYYLCAFTDGMAYIAAKQAMRGKKSDWMARNLKSAVFSVALRCRDPEIRGNAQSALVLLRQMFQFDDNMVFRISEETPHWNVKELSKHISLLFESVWDYVYQNLRESDFKSLTTTAMHLHPEFDDSGRTINIANVGAIRDTISNIQRIFKNQPREFDLELILKPIYNSMVLLTDNSLSWGEKKAQLQASIEEFDPNILKSLSEETETVEFDNLVAEIDSLASNNQSISTNTQIQQVSSIRKLGLGEKAELKNELLRIERECSMNKRYLGAHYIAGILELLSNVGA